MTLKIAFFQNSELSLGGNQLRYQHILIYLKKRSFKKVVIQEIFTKSVTEH